MGVVSTHGAVIGMLTAGRMSDWLFRRGYRDILLLPVQEPAVI